MRRLLILLGLAAGCRAAPPPSPPPAAPPPPAPVAAPAAPTPAPPPAPSPQERYRAALEQDVAGSRRLRRLARFPGDIEVRTFRGRRRQDGVLYLTLRSGPSELPELLARADRSGPEVAEVLAAVAARCAQAPPCEGYHPLALPEPVRHLQHFDLVPAGAARVEDRDVPLLRVLPLTEEEYEAATSETKGAWSGAASADLDAKASAAARWAPALEAEPAPEPR